MVCLLEVFLRSLAAAATFLNNSPLMRVMSALASIISEMETPCTSMFTYWGLLSLLLTLTMSTIPSESETQNKKRSMGPHSVIHYHLSNHYYTRPCCNLSCVILIGVFLLTRVTLTFLFPITTFTIYIQMTYVPGYT